MSELQIERIPLAAIRPYWRNPRDSDPAVEAVKRSIQEYGFNTPIILDPDRVIVAGHTRYKAVMQLGWSDVPCITVDLPPEKVKAYRIADNKTSELAEWDEAKLNQELREIPQVTDLQVYFPNYDLSQLLTIEAGQALPDITQGDIDKTRMAGESLFKNRDGERASGMVDLTCPHCGETISVNRSELNDQPANPT
jgi:site-specific DNA-methyltransferase (adenine-specific)